MCYNIDKAACRTTRMISGRHFAVPINLCKGVGSKEPSVRAMRVSEMNREALEAFQAQCQKEYAAFQAEGLKLDMSRGKPAPKQLDLTNGILTCLSEEDYRAENGLDCRNYGCLDGLPEAKAFFAPMLGVLSLIHI